MSAAVAGPAPIAVLPGTMEMVQAGQVWHRTAGDRRLWQTDVDWAVRLGRPGQPVELAPVYVLLASQEASYITGEVYGVTGGRGVA